MRIAVNSRLLVPGKTDGIARFTIECFKRICAAHPEVEFTFIFDRDHQAFDFGSNTKNVTLYPPARHPILWYIWFEHQLKRYLNKRNFDLFVSPEGWLPPKLKMPSLAVMHDLNFIHQGEHVAPSHRNFLQRYFPKYAKRADRIATVSAYSKQDIAQTFSFPEEKIDVVYNGVSEIFSAINEDEKRRIKEKYAEGKDFFVFIGTLHPRKNLDHLFLAFDLFKKKTRSDLKLLIVGNKKWWPEDLQKIIDQMEHREELIFCGRLEDEEAAKVLASSLALSYLPHFEGFGIPILEAFASEVSVITANNTSLPEVAGEAALLCDSKDPEEIAKAMQKITEDPDLRQKLIEKGKVQLKKFSWDKSATKLWDSMQNCLQQHGS